MQEIVINLHMHTRYSDGSGSHADIAQAALRAGLDAVIVTDHNVWAQGLEGYYKEGAKRALMLVGEEIHDQDRVPQKNHLLVIGAGRELAQLADDPQALINGVREAGGLSFIAHPFDPPQPFVNEPDIFWVDWDVQGYTGIELWNGLSEFKGRINNKLLAIFYAFFPACVARGPDIRTLKKWDKLLANGKRIVAVGGSDAHALHASMGPVKRVIYPYVFHFKAINTHLFLSQPLSGDLSMDRRLILEALRAGHAFVGYDLPAPTRGFRFTAQGRQASAIMGDEIQARGGVTLQAHLPEMAEIHLLKDGQVIRVWKKQQICTHITTEPGVYRVEVYRRYLGRRRGWIFSNPIYLK